jgi:hypothetical protein
VGRKHQKTPDIWNSTLQFERQSRWAADESLLFVSQPVCLNSICDSPFSSSAKISGERILEDVWQNIDSDLYLWVDFVADAGVQINGGL